MHKPSKTGLAAKAILIGTLALAPHLFYGKTPVAEEALQTRPVARAELTAADSAYVRSCRPLSKESLKQAIGDARVVLIGDDHSDRRYLDFIADSTRSGFFKEMGFDAIGLEYSHTYQSFVDSCGPDGPMGERLKGILGGVAFSDRALRDTTLIKEAKRNGMDVRFVMRTRKDIPNGINLPIEEYVAKSNEGVVEEIVQYLQANGGGMLFVFAGSDHKKVGRGLEERGVSFQRILLRPAGSEPGVERVREDPFFDPTQSFYSDRMEEACTWDRTGGILSEMQRKAGQAIIATAQDGRDPIIIFGERSGSSSRP